MNQPFRVVFLKAVLFVVLLEVGATLQMWSGWSGFVAVGLSLLPAFVFVWFHLPDRKTRDEFRADEAIVLYLTILGAGYVVFDVMQAPIDSNAASWFMLLIGGLPILCYRFSKSQLIRSQSAVANQSKSS